MPTSIFNDLALRAASFAMDGLSLRQRVTANNIANVDTPNYKAQSVSFENQLQQALTGDEEPGLPLQTTNVNHLGHTGSSANNAISVQYWNNVHRNDSNNVDVDLEMTTLAETTLRYQALTQMAGGKIAFLKNIVRGGR